MKTTVNIEHAGTLEEILGDNTSEITHLTITGKIDAQDFTIIRDKMSKLNGLDIENVVINEYFGSKGTKAKYLRPGYFFSDQNVHYPANTIPQYAFAHSKITYFKLPNNISSIDDCAFMHCGKSSSEQGFTSKPIISRSVSFIPSSVISIGKYAFYLSKELGNFKIPASINNIGSGAFVGCEDVTVESTSPYYICDIDDGGILFNIDKSIILHVPDYFGFDYSINTTEYYNEFIIPDSVVKIDNGAFYNSRLSSVTIPKTVKEIGDEAFYLCINLKRVNFQQSSELTYIGENAFQYCNIKYINLPNTLKHIGKGAIVENRIGFIKIPNTIDYKCDLSIYLDSNIRYIFTERDIPLDVEEVDKLHVFEDDSKGLRFYMHENEAFQKCILFVPNDSINIYKEKPFWRKFQYILPINKENVLVYNSEPGNLLNVLGNNFASVTNLTIKGVLNARDFKTLRDNLPILTILDIQDVIIEECWGSYEGDDDFSYNTDYKLYPSNSIPRYAFYNESTKVSNALLTSISLPKSTTKIGNHSFFNSAINSIAIPENVEIIEQFAFCGCDNLEKVYFENNKSLIHIEVCAFGNCEMLKNIIIPESVRSIDNSAFFDCKDLENVVFEKGSALTTIGKHAFYGCIKIQMIKIPSLVCDIKDCAFERCRSLEKLIFETNASIKNIGAKAFSNCINLRSIVLPSSIETIGEFAFSSCNKLTNLSFGSIIKLKSIEKGTFQSCNMLQTIYIPQSVEQIRESAFEGCEKLKFIVITNSVKSIGDQAFNSCSSLKWVNIPSSVESIGLSTFNNCSKIEELIISNTVTCIKKNSFLGINGDFYVDDNNSHFSSINGVLFNKDVTELLRCPESKVGKYTIPDSVKYIGENAFSNCKTITVIIIPQSVIEIGIKSFYGCEGLMSIYIPKSVQLVRNSAFENCKNLEIIDFDESIDIKIVSERVFCNCEKLESVNIPKSVYNIGHKAFEHCTNLRSVYFEESSILDYISKKAFSHCTNLRIIDLPDSVDKIENNAFYNCQSLKTIKIPAKILSIDFETFRNCSNLESIQVPASVEVINAKAFMNCINLKKIHFELESQIQSIEDFAFASCRSLETINFSLSIKNIGDYAFTNCNSLVLENIPSFIKEINVKAFEKYDDFWILFR